MKWNESAASALAGKNGAQIWTPAGTDASSTREQMKIGSGTHFQWKRHSARWLLGRGEGELIKLSRDDFRSSKVQLSNFLLRRIKDIQVLGMVLTLLRFKVTLQFHWFSAIAFNKERHRINLNQEQNFLLSRTWVSPELILWNLGAKHTPYRAHWLSKQKLMYCSLTRHCFVKLDEDFCAFAISEKTRGYYETCTKMQTCPQGLVILVLWERESNSPLPF